MMRFLRFKRTLVAAGVAVVLVGGTIGLAVAQQAPTQTPTSTPDHGRPGQVFLDALAQQLGITTDHLQQAITAARTQVGLPPEGGRSGFGPGPRPGFRSGVAFGMGLQAAADAIGITTDQLRQELPGKSLAQVAQAHGKNPADVATTLKNEANLRIDQAVSAGKQNLDQHIDDLMNHVLPDKRIWATFE